MKKKKIKNKLVITFILIIISSFLLLYFYSTKISPILMKYAKINSKREAIEIISKDVSDEVIDLLNNNDLFIVTKDNNGNVEIVDYNTKIVNEVLSLTSKKVVSNFDNFAKNNNNIIMKIPIGVVSNNIFFKNFGPKVPVKISLDGNVLTSLKTNIKEYGLNSALIEISVKIEANIVVMLPLVSDEIKVVNEVPVSLKLSKGNVSSILNSE